MNNEIKQNLLIECADGYILDAVSFDCSLLGISPSEKKGIVVFSSALGVGCSHYFKLATYLAQQGFDAICFNYRGTGARPANYSEFEFTLADWGRLDVDAVIRHASDKSLPVYYIGHSIGGQLLPLCDSANHVERAILMAASAPYWGRWPFPANIQMLLTCQLVLPLAASLYTEFPASKFGLGNLEIPPHLIKEWCRWIRKPDYLLDESFNLDAIAKFSACNVPVLAYAFSDDKMAPLANIEKLISFWGGTRKSIVLRKPIDLGVNRIGHSGFVSSKFESILWKELSDYLLEEN